MLHLQLHLRKECQCICSSALAPCRLYGGGFGLRGYGPQQKWLIALFAVIMVGIWWTAVYSGHHYLIDVMLGISCALLGIFVFEKGLMKWGAFGRFFERYSRYIK